ncbi:MAG: VWA domain-containing protein [Pirellulales bacterium]
MSSSAWGSPTPQPVPQGILYTAVPYVAEPVYDAPPTPPAAPPAPAPAAAAPANTTPADEAAEAPAPGRFEIRRDFFYTGVAGLASAAVHFLLILLLGLWAVPPIVRPKVEILQSSIEEPRKIEEIVHRLDKNMQPATQLADASSASSVQSAIAMQSMTQATLVQSPKLNATVVNKPTKLSIDVGAVNVFTTAGTTLAASVPQGTLGEALATADGYGTAMDILTQEILNRLARGKVLVVWVFDQSLSMKDDQAEIKSRIGRVYEELGLSSATRGDALWTGVVSYGKTFAVHTTKPTTVQKEIEAAIDAVPVDESGEEMMCYAVDQSVANFRQFSGAGGGRQLMLVLVSDESGNPDDNVRSLEPTIAACKQARASVYALGREAVFGYPFAHMNWTVTRQAVGGGTMSRSYVVPVDRGPETPMVELLQTEGFQRRMDAHPSGFGPYEQVRLARETGGMFLMLPSPELLLFRRDETVFDFEAMRPFLPDLRDRASYAKERDYSPLRALIWKVINDLNPYKPEIGRYINLAQRFSGDRAEWNREMDAEMAKAKQYVLYLDAAEKALRGAQPLRGREKEPRWRAHYDLTLAQVVAYKARVYEYGAYLALFRQNPKPFDPPTANRELGGWNLNERGATVADKITKPIAENASNMFRAIIAEYPGTPWATRAEYELRRGYGIDLRPWYFNPNPPPNPRRPVTPFAPPKI